MKVFCRYSMVDVNTGALLSFGEKWKELNALKADYINDGTQGLFRKYTMYHRNLTIHGRRCTVFLFALHFRRRGNYFNCITELGFDRRVNGQLVCAYPKINSENFTNILKVMGIVGAGAV